MKSQICQFESLYWCNFFFLWYRPNRP